MNCPSCNAIFNNDLSYCKRCGTKLSPSSNTNDIASSGSDQKKHIRLTSWITPLTMAGLAGISVGGLAIILSTAVVLIERGVPLGAAMFLAIISLLIFFSTIAWLGHQIVRLSNASERVDNFSKQGEMIESEQQHQQPKSLPEPPPSVVENTTRIFEPAYTKRRN